MMGCMKNSNDGKLVIIWDILREKIHFKICEWLISKIRILR